MTCVEPHTTVDYYDSYPVGVPGYRVDRLRSDESMQQLRRVIIACLVARGALSQTCTACPGSYCTFDSVR
jgi:hypothetical protein